MTKFSLSKKEPDDENWISVSDLMAGLMMFFLLIAIIYAKDANQQIENAKEIAMEWRDGEHQIYQSLLREFEDDLLKWNATIDKETLTIRFLSPTILFKSGKSELSNAFKAVLADFMPRYIQLLVKEFDEQISEVRIEGHTSSEWAIGATENEAFVRNMALSQERTREVLQYSLQISSLQSFKPWMHKTVSAHGLSSARVILQDGIENKELSRRVEFTIKSKTKETLFKVLDKIAPVIEKKI